MMKSRQLLRNNYLRKEEDICRDYLTALLEKKVITPEKANKLTSAQVMDILDKKVHETTELNGATVSTLDAFYHFVEFIIQTDVATNRKIWNRLVKWLFKIFENNRYAAVQVSRGHGKSFFWCLYILFKAYTNPYFECIYSSNTPKMGKRFFRTMNRMIDSNELLDIKRNPTKKKEIISTQEEMEYNHGFIEITSVGTTPRSAHVNLIVADDILRDDKRYSDEYVENYVFGQLFPIAQRKRARLCLTGTPFHYKDILNITMQDENGKLIEDGRLSTGPHKGFFSQCFPAILDENTQSVLLPEAFSYEDLMRIKETQGELFFMREYLLKCIDEKKSLFPYRLIRSCTDTSFNSIYTGEKDKTYIIAADVATSGKASADFSAYVTLELMPSKADPDKGDHDYTPIKVVRNIFHEKGVEVSKQIDILKDYSIRFNNCVVFVEKNNVGVALVQDLIRRSVHVEEFVTDTFKKEAMIRYLINEMEHGRVIFPDDTDEIKNLKKELREFGLKIVRGHERMQAIGAHDDLVIALALAVYGTTLSAGGLPFAICQN